MRRTMRTVLWVELLFDKSSYPCWLARAQGHS